MLIEGVASGEGDLIFQPKQTHSIHPKPTLHELDAFWAQMRKLRTAEGQALIEQGRCI